MNPQSNAMRAWLPATFGSLADVPSSKDIDGRYSGYGLVVQSDPSLEEITLEPYTAAVRNAFLTSVGELKGSLAAACRQPDATGRFFRVGVGLYGKVLFVMTSGDGFRTLDMESMAIKEVSEDEMWELLKDAHIVGGLYPLMPARMPI